MDITDWFGIFELPFLVLCIVFAFLTAGALRGGAFGRGMGFLAWGFLVMGIGHLHMQIDRFFAVNLFERILGATAGNIAWILALILTWTLSGIGFYNIYKASTTR